MITGLIHNGIRYDVSVSAFICDAPARAFLKCIKGPSGYSQLWNMHYYWCIQQESSCAWGGRQYFPPRTQEGFANVEYERHQVMKSPLIDLRINCVKQFSLDYMHMFCFNMCCQAHIVFSHWRSHLSPSKIRNITEACGVQLNYAQWICQTTHIIVWSREVESVRIQTVCLIHWYCGSSWNCLQINLWKFSLSVGINNARLKWEEGRISWLYGGVNIILRWKFKDIYGDTYSTNHVYLHRFSRLRFCVCV